MEDYGGRFSEDVAGWKLGSGQILGGGQNFFFNFPGARVVLVIEVVRKKLQKKIEKKLEKKT